MINGFGHLYSATEQHIAKIREIKTEVVNKNWPPR